jgi:hypothetical protein
VKHIDRATYEGMDAYMLHAPLFFGTYFLSAVLIPLKDRGNSYYTYNYYR